MTTTPATVLRLAQAVPETPESFLIVRELIKALEDLVAIADRDCARSQLDDIEGRLNAAAPGAVTITPSDIHYLLTLARKQADALERVEALADSFDGLGSHASYHGTEAEMETWLSAANHLRAALEPKP